MIEDGYALACHDCGLAYKSPAFADFVVPDDVWLQISPTGHAGGILCANCINGRAAALGIETPHARFTSGPFADGDWRKPASAFPTPPETRHAARRSLRRVPR
jgi:hypothetical protein